jgi:HlyD family secretion protein
MQKLKNLNIFIKIILGVAILGIGYFIYNNYLKAKLPVIYEYAKVTVKDLQKTVEGSGKVVSLSELDIQQLSGGKVTSVLVKPGDYVKKGQVIARLDNRSASIALQQAQNNVTSAKASYAKFISGATNNDRAVSEISVENAQLSVDNAQQNLNDKLKLIVIDVQNDVNSTNNLFENYNTFFPSFIGDSINFSNELLITQIVSLRGEINQDLENIDTNSIEMLKNILNKEFNYFDKLHDLFINNTIVETTTNSKIENYKSSFANIKTKSKSNFNNINTGLQSITTAKKNLEQSNLNKDIKVDAPRSEDITIQKASLNNAYISLQSAQNNYENTIIRAPFDGQIGSVAAIVGQQTSTQAGVATIITKDKIAEISLNEIDIVNVKLGQDVTLTFDAIPNEIFKGSVSQINTVGNNTSNVVTFGVKIAIPNADDRIKSGMSVTANIIVIKKNKILTLPTGTIKNEKIKNENNKIKYFVEIKGVKKVFIEVGMTNNVDTEVLSGLVEDDEVISKITDPNVAAKTASTFSLFGGGPPGQRQGGTGGTQTGTKKN